MSAKIRVVSVLLLVAIVCGVRPIPAAEGDPPCLAEIRRICPLVPTGLAQACLQAHASQLSADCAKHVGEVNADIDRLHRDCETDAARFCAAPQTAAGQRATCLLKHRDALSPTCRRALDSVSTQ